MAASSDMKSAAIAVICTLSDAYLYRALTLQWVSIVYYKNSCSYGLSC